MRVCDCCENSPIFTVVCSDCSGGWWSVGVFMSLHLLYCHCTTSSRVLTGALKYQLTPQESFSLCWGPSGSPSPEVVVERRTPLVGHQRVLSWRLLQGQPRLSGHSSAPPVVSWSTHIPVCVHSSIVCRPLTSSVYGSMRRRSHRRGQRVRR